MCIVLLLADDENSTSVTKHVLVNSRYLMATLVDLNPGRQYRVTLQAINNLGVSDESEAITVETAEQGTYESLNNADSNIMYFIITD